MLDHKKIPLFPGYPDHTIESIKLFQRNNGLKADGIIGPKTLAMCWPEAKEGSYATRYAPYEYGRRKAMESKSFAIFNLLSDDTHVNGISSENLLTLFEVVSSNWSTGFDWLSGEDGLTIGFRRYAASTAASVLSEYYGWYFGPSMRASLDIIMLRLLESIEDAPNNGWPMCDPYMRALLMDFQSNLNWWRWQIINTLDDWDDKIFSRYPKWSSGRLFGLAVRARNSSGRYVRNLPDDDMHAWRVLGDRYTDHGKNEHRVGRIRRIERLIPAGEVWR